MGTAAQERLEVTVGTEQVTITSPLKPVWPDKNIRKQDYLIYLTQASPYLLPFLQNRSLTVIRYPHGVGGESFFQKNCPAYAPDYIKRHKENGIEYIVCDNLETLIWLGNQLAIELHVPFNRIDSHQPSEIVFDLDPPSRESFHLAVEAALIFKDVLDRLKLISFVKTSGNKGLQIYIPLPEKRYTYEETRLFTSFLSDYLVAREPEWFTTERLKKNRGKRLYVDYVQHAEGKTIIAPYSLRANPQALVSTPLYWHEVTRTLLPDDFPMEVIMPRIQANGCPFADFARAKQQQPFADVLAWLLREKAKN